MEKQFLYKCSSHAHNIARITVIPVDLNPNDPHKWVEVVGYNPEGQVAFELILYGARMDKGRGDPTMPNIEVLPLRLPNA
jgi:hypothetical protein